MISHTHKSNYELCIQKYVIAKSREQLSGISVFLLFIFLSVLATVMACSSCL